MAEFCLNCFLDICKPNAYDRTHIVISNDNEFCEGCMDCVPYVDHIDSSDKKACATAGDFIGIVSHLRHEQKAACVDCGNTFGHDDVALVAETGECPYCHMRVAEIWIKD